MVYLGLGSNLGEREAHLASALRAIAETPRVELIAAADAIATKPVGGPPGQGDFLNAACAVETTLTPRRFLLAMQAIETAAGRDRLAERERWGPRIIDIDILLWDGMVVVEPDLTIPHPLLAERRFALEPLAAIAPHAVHPELGLTVRELLERLPHES